MYYCASCGIAEIDDVKLKECDGCDLVRYCSDDCQQDHRPEHEAKCKERAASLRDEILFRQPESRHYGDCPICCLPLSIVPFESNLMSCCSKLICNVCWNISNTRQWEEKRQQPKCPFCRHPLPTTTEEAIMQSMKRVAANDPVALCKLGERHYYEGDFDGAFKYLTMSAELGDEDAHFQLALMHEEEKGVEKDEKKELYHLEEAAIGGHLIARHNLGYREDLNGRPDRAVKHYIIAANLGHDLSIQKLKEHYRNGGVSKDEFAAALRAHHAAVSVLKSHRGKKQQS